MTDQKTDRRVRKTRKLLRQSLTKLLMEKELKDISVLELVGLADINRGTFYLHYKDIYDLYEQTESEILNEFNRIIKKHTNVIHRNGIPFLAVLDALEFLAKNADVCMAILKINGKEFLSKLIEMNKPTDPKAWQDLLGKEREGQYEYYYSFITSGCVGLIQSWFINGMKETPKKIAELAEQLMTNSIRD